MSGNYESKVVNQASGGGGGSGASISLDNLNNPTAISQDLIFAGTASRSITMPTDANNTTALNITIRGQDKTGFDQSGGNIIFQGGSATGVSTSLPGEIRFTTGGGGYALYTAKFGYNSQLFTPFGIYFGEHERIGGQSGFDLTPSTGQMRIWSQGIIIAQPAPNVWEQGVDIMFPSDVSVLPGTVRASLGVFQGGAPPAGEIGTLYPARYTATDNLLIGYPETTTGITTASMPTGMVRVKSGVNLQFVTDNIILNASGSALSTSATTGFTYLPSMAGTPSGTPATTVTGALPMVADSTASKLWIRFGSTWKSVTLA